MGDNSDNDAPAGLAIGERIAAKIRARPTWNDTNVWVREGEKYRLSAAGVWYDAIFSAGPEGYKSPCAYFERLEPRRRVPTADWFALIVTVGQDESSALVVYPMPAPGPRCWKSRGGGRCMVSPTIYAAFIGTTSGASR